MNIVIPMCGFGRRFADAGFKNIKPMIEINRYKMIDLVLKSFNPKDSNVIFITLKQFATDEMRSALHKYGSIFELEEPTTGAVSTVLSAEYYIDNNHPLVIMNCDQYLKLDENKFRSYCEQFDACIATFKSNSPMHSYVDVDENNIAKRLAEKVVISDNAVAGIYYIRHGYLFVRAANDMIRKNITTNGEFYISPVFNEMINKNYKVAIYNMDKKDANLLGTPEQLNEFINKLSTGETTIE